MARFIVDDYGVVTFPRQTFVNEVFDPQIGDCVTCLAPYGGGKSRFLLELLGVTASPKLPATGLVMKPKDIEVSRFAKEHKFAIIRDWPPTIAKSLRKPPGYILWPVETGNPPADDIRHRGIFQRCLRQMYTAAKKKPSIVFADETYSLEHELKLSLDLNRIWTKGRSVGLGLWAASQRPVYISRWAYQAQHLFLGNETDADAQKRYGEIGGGIDPIKVRNLVANLQRFQFVYINREERSICIVDA